MASSSSSSSNWVYDVFVSFRGTDVRDKFLSHFQKELDRKLIKTFIDERIKKGQSIDSVLKEAIRTSRIAVVVFSENYASSSWCLDELVEIVKCKKDLGQLVIPIFYGLDPTHVRNQNGKFGQVFAKTCEEKSQNETKLWQQSLIEVANLCGNHSQNWANEAKMVEEIANDVLNKKLDLIPQKEFENFVGMEDHIEEMNALLDLESEEVRMIGIWGSSGIGKTSIARTLYNQISHRFQCKIFIDKAFISNVMEKYKNVNPYDPNVKLNLVGSFLSEILGKKDIKIDSFDAMRQMLKHNKVLIFIDDLNHQEVLATLVGQTQWFGCWSRIIVITKDKKLLRAHGIDHIYEVRLPSHELALKMFCKSAFGKYLPPDGLMEFASKISRSAGNLPLGLHVLGSFVRGRQKEDLIEMLPDLLKGLNGDIKKTLRVSYDGLDDENHKAIFRHIACLFNGERASDVKLLLADSDIDVIIGLRNLVDKSLIDLRYGRIEMHTLLQKLGKEIVRAQSNEPGEREFLMDAKDIGALLKNNTGTNRVLGIALDMEELHRHELRIHESAFEKMLNLVFLKIYTKDWYQKTLTTKWDKEKGVRWHLPEGFDYLPQRLRWLRFDQYPGRCMPSSFCPENLVKLDMRGSKLEKLWEGVHTLNGLKEMDLTESIYLKEIPDLSKATNLEKLYLRDCSSLVELPFSIKYLNKLEKLDMWRCSSLETLPNGINLQSLDRLILYECPRLNSFPDISTNTSTLCLGQGYYSIYEGRGNIGMKRITSETLWGRAQPYSLRILYLEEIPSLVELPSSIKNFIQLETLEVRNCINLETLPTDINFCSLRVLRFSECSRLRMFPNISTNIEELYFSETGIEEVPWWIENFTKLKSIEIRKCSKLVRVSININKLKLLEEVRFNDCKALSGGNIGITGETLWGRAEPYSLRELYISDIPSLVELPSSIKNFIHLEELYIYDCINLETLPTDINFCALRDLSFNGCSRLRIFPNISTNIEELHLDETGIEEVPWWIENFTKLKTIGMNGCQKLVRVSLNIYKLKLLEKADFIFCWALREASWNDHPIAIEEVLSGVEVPLHFIHQTTGSSLPNIPLSQQLFKFRACVVVVFDSEVVDFDSEEVDSDSEEVDSYIDVRCEFKDRLGNSFVWVSKNKVFISYGWDSVVFVLDSPLDECNSTHAQLNYDHVDMEIHSFRSWLTRTKNTIKRWGVQLLDNLISESEHNEERERNRKRERETGSLDFREIQCMKRQDTSTHKLHDFFH